MDMKTSGINMVAGQHFEHEQNTAYKKSPTGYTDPVAVGGMLRLYLISVFLALSLMGSRTMLMLSK